MITPNLWERFIASPRYIQFYRNRLLLEWKSEWTYQSLLILVRYEGTEKWERHPFPLTGHNLADAGHAEHLREPLKQLAHRAPRVDTQTMEIYLVPLTMSFGDLFIFLRRYHSAPRFDQMHKIGSIPILHPLLIRDTPVKATSDESALNEHAPTKALPAPQSQTTKKRMKLARLAKFYANRFIKRRAQILAGLVIALVRTKRIKIRWLEKRTVPQSITTTNNNDDGKEKQDMKENENNESQETQKPEPTALPPSGPAAEPAPPAIPAGSETIPTSAEDAGGDVPDIEKELEQLAKSDKPSDAGAANLLLIRQLAEQTEQAARELEARKQLEDAKANIEAAAQKDNEAAAQRIQELNRKNSEVTLVQQQTEARAKEVEARLAKIEQETAEKIARLNADTEAKVAKLNAEAILNAEAAAQVAVLKQQLDAAKTAANQGSKKKWPSVFQWIIIVAAIVLVGFGINYLLRDKQMDMTSESDALKGKSAVSIACGGTNQTNSVSSTNAVVSPPAPTVNTVTNDARTAEMEMLYQQAQRDGEQWKRVAQNALTLLDVQKVLTPPTQVTTPPGLVTTNDLSGAKGSSKKNSGVGNGSVNIGGTQLILPYAPTYNMYFGPTNQPPLQTPPPAHKAKGGGHADVGCDCHTCTTSSCPPGWNPTSTLEIPGKLPVGEVATAQVPPGGILEIRINEPEKWDIDWDNSRRAFSVMKGNGGNYVDDSEPHVQVPYPSSNERSRCFYFKVKGNSTETLQFRIIPKR